MVLHGFASRSPKNKVLRPKTLKYDQKLKNETKNPKIIQKYFRLILSRLVAWKRYSLVRSIGGGAGPHQIKQLNLLLATFDRGTTHLGELHDRSHGIPDCNLRQGARPLKGELVTYLLRFFGSIWAHMGPYGPGPGP